MSTIVRTVLTLLLLATVPITSAVWLISIEEVQGWAISRAGDEPLAQYEAVGTAEAAWWCLRVSVPFITFLAAIGIWRSRAVGRMVIQLWNAFLVATTVVRKPKDSDKQGLSVSNVPDSRSCHNTILLRIVVAGWLLLACYHAGHGVMQRLRDWPVYRFHSGSDVLPNMSQQNREVIRYVAQATPPGSRILVLSDQRLFFLSYYLLPRRVYHPLHPGGEFVIPQPNGQQQLPAYRLKELDPAYLHTLKPDYVLEYFEGPIYADVSRLTEDGKWLAFQRERHGPGYQPEFLVSLRPYSVASFP